MAKELRAVRQIPGSCHIKREIGWATVRDKILYGELDAAHALAPMVFAATLGLGRPRLSASPAWFESPGDALTLSNSLWQAVAPAEDPLDAFLQEGREQLVLGVPFLYSSHHFLVRSWLQSRGLTPERAARFVVVPRLKCPRT